MIRPAVAADAQRISEIYNHYVRETFITFEDEPVAVSEMEGRIADVTARFPWLVCETDGADGSMGGAGSAMVGYAYAASWKTRSAYRQSVESTIYLAPEAVGRGLGRSLYEKLVAELRGLGLHCAVGGIALPNAASVALHERLGFRKIGHFEEIGWKFGKWIDVGYWELLL